jgi:hypothetical protein
MTYRAIQARGITRRHFDGLYYLLLVCIARARHCHCIARDLDRLVLLLGLQNKIETIPRLSDAYATGFFFMYRVSFTSV